MRKCIYCGKVPRVIDMGGLFYVQCCNKFDLYQFCGVHPKNAIAAWDNANSIGAKVNMERCRKIRKEQCSKFIYLVDGQSYESVHQIALALKCSEFAIQGKFNKSVNSIMFRDHLILRIRKAKRKK